MAGIRKEGIKLVVFDFDQTLSVVHVFKALAGWGDVELAVPAPFAVSERGQMRRIAELSASEFREVGGFAHAAFGGSTRITMVRQLLQGLRDEGTELILCTKGLVGAAQKCLQDLGLLQFFSKCYGNTGDVYGMEPYDAMVSKDSPDQTTSQLMGKEDLGRWGTKAALIEMLLLNRGLSREHCVLVEDDPRECFRAEPVCRTLLVEEAAGITRAHAEQLLTMAKKAEIRKVFDRFDLNRDGFISKDELGQVLRTLNDEWTEAENALLFAVADLNGDDRIQYSEFVDWVYAGGDEELGAAMHGQADGVDDGEPEKIRSPAELLAINIVHAMTGDPLASLHCKPSDTVASLKKQLETESGNKGPWEALWNSDVLDDAIKLSAVGLEDGATISFIRGAEPRVVTSSADGKVRIWNVETGECLDVLHGHSQAVNSVSASADGQLLVTASEDLSAILWNLKSGKQLLTFYGHLDALYSAAFSPTAAMVVTTSHDNTARLWKVPTGECALVVTGHTDSVFSASFSSNEDRIVTASADGSACIWSLPDGECLNVLLGHRGWVRSAIFSKHGQMIVTAGFDSTAKLWSVKTGECLQTYCGHTGRVYSACFSPDGESVLTAAHDRTARIWERDSASGKVFAQHEDRLQFAAFSPNGKFVVTASWDSTCKLWDASTATCLQQFEGHRAGVLCAVYVG